MMMIKPEMVHTYTQYPGKKDVMTNKKYFLWNLIFHSWDVRMHFSSVYSAGAVTVFALNVNTSDSVTLMFNKEYSSQTVDVYLMTPVGDQGLLSKYVQSEYTLKKEPLKQWQDSLFAVLQSKILIQWMRIQSLNKDFTVQHGDQGISWFIQWFLLRVYNYRIVHLPTILKILYFPINRHTPNNRHIPKISTANI